MKKSSLVLMFVIIGFLGVSPSWADLIPSSRISDYTINSDGSFTYENEWTFTNDGATDVVIPTGAFILYHGASVSTSGFDYFTYNHNDPSFARTFDFDYNDAAGSSSVTRNYNADYYDAQFTVGAGETKTIQLSYSGPAGIWAEQSSNTTYPWVDEYGYWEFVGDGFWTAPFNKFTVNLTLPTTLQTYELLGWDVYPTVSGNQFTFEMSNVQGVDMDIAFRTSAPLSHVPEPATMLLLGSGLVGLAGVRRKFCKK